MAEDDIDEAAVDEDPAAAEPPTLEDRERDLSKIKSIEKQLLDIYKSIEQGFSDQVERSNDQMDYWDIYNCKLNYNQFYTGNSKIYVPLVHNAVEARVTRFTNQIFPQSGRNVEVTSEDEDMPQATTALLENYVRKSKLRTDVIPALLRNGDVEGQYTIYVDWQCHKRHVAWRAQSQPMTPEGIPIPGEAPVEDIHEETIEDAFPDVEVIADADLLTLPQTADSVDSAIAAGGSVTVVRRWTAAKIRSLIREGAIDKDAGTSLIGSMTRWRQSDQKFDKKKKMVDAAGIHTNDNGVKYALVYEVWCLLKVKKEWRICRAYLGGPDKVLGCTLNPFWSDRVPILSCPVKKIAGSFKGLSQIKFCADMQYQANDAINEGMDSAAYSLMPIIMTDPEKNPRIGSMVLALSAIWETSPNDTQFAEFPQLWTQSLEIVAAASAQVATALAVSPAAITQQTNDNRLSQAEISNEQQVDLLTTADAVTVLEQGILTPMLMRFAEMDHQYRLKPIMVRQYGSMGVRATMEEIGPLQMDNLYQFRWFGVESAQNAQQIQMQIATVNVLRGIPPQSYPGYRLNLQPVIAQMVENSFGPRLAPLVFEDMKSQLEVPAELENELLVEGIDLQVHQMDNDIQHMQAHLPVLMQGDPTGVVRVHMLRHKMALETKAGMGALPSPEGTPGVPGGAVGGQAQPGVAGTPRIGAVPGSPRGGQQPPGAIHQDRLKDASKMPRAQRG